MKKLFSILILLLAALMLLASCNGNKECTHTPGESVTETLYDPTCVNPGQEKKTVRCTACNEILSEVITDTPKLDHEYGTDHHTADSYYDYEIGESIYASAATCVKEGVEIRVYSCEMCNDQRVEIVKLDKLEHTLGEDIEKYEYISTAPTCSMEGVCEVTLFCHICNITLEHYTSTVPKSEHNSDEPVVENYVPAGCDKEGYCDMTIYCLTCGDELKRVGTVLPTIEHTASDPVIENVIDATFDNAGSYEEVVYCSVCKFEISRTKKTTDILSHNPAKSVKENIISPTCISTGSYDEVIYCSDCGTELSRTTHTTAKTSHTRSDPQTENVISSTCSSTGSYDEVIYCSVCTTELERTKITTSVSDHSPAGTVIENNVEASCKLPGGYDEVVYCSSCSKELSRTTVVTDPIPHSPSDKIIENKINSTCTSAGSYDEVTYCTVCSIELKRTNVITSATDHVMSDMYIENKIDSTCTSAGQYDEVIYCTLCSVVLERKAVITDKLDHTPMDKVVENRIEPICDKNGSYDEVVYCLSCNGEIERTKHVINATMPHNYVGNECTVCKDLIDSTGLGLTLSSSKAYYILTGRGSCQDSNVVIPSHHNGIPIKEIAAGAFSSDTSLRSIKIPDTITYIGASALSGCTSIESITLPFVGDAPTGATSTTFGYLFGSNYYLNNHKYVPESLKSVTVTGSADIAGNAFYNCQNLTSIVISDDVQKIGANAFYNCTALESITLPFDGTGATSGTFGDLFGLSHASFKSTLKTIVITKAFHGLSELKYIENVTLPGTITTIPANAFKDCVGLKYVIIPEGVTNIQNSAFNNCQSLVSIDMPSTTTTIGSLAFYGCKSLTSIKIPQKVHTIGEQAFKGCTRVEQFIVESGNYNFRSIDGNLYNVFDELSLIAYAVGKKDTIFVVPDTVKTIAEGAFYGCEYLTDITIPFIGSGSNDSTCFGYIFGVENNSIPQNIKKVTVKSGLKSDSFKKCSNITDITLVGILTIPISAFEDCSSLKNITFTNGISEISASAFKYCRSLESIDLGDFLTAIGGDAFKGCTGLKSIALPGSVTDIGNGAFNQCSSLESITLPFVGGDLFSSSTAYIGYIFGAGSYSQNSSYVPKSLKTVIVDAGWNYNDMLERNGKTIQGYAFYGCSYIENAIIKNTSIARYAFEGCTQLKSVTFGSFDGSISRNSGIYVNPYAFKDCIRLEQVIVANIANDGDYKDLIIDQTAFNGCANIKNVYYVGTAEEWEANVVTPDALTGATFHFNYNP